MSTPHPVPEAVDVRLAEGATAIVDVGAEAVLRRESTWIRGVRAAFPGRPQPGFSPVKGVAVFLVARDNRDFSPQVSGGENPAGIGEARDRVGVRRVLEEAFADLRFYDEDGPDLSGLRESGDRQRSALAEAAEAVIDELDWEFEGREPSREEVLRHALALIWNAEAD